MDRIQIVAGSGSLADRANRVTQQVLPWLYRPRALSFGWAEDGEIGLAFRRTLTGKDAAGREGAFFAHALIWERGRLPVALLAGLWNAPVWQDRPPETLPGELAFIQDPAALGISSAPPEPQLVTNSLARVLEHLAAGRRTSLPGTAEQALQLAAALAAILPAKYGLVSFSTAEGADQADRYDLLAGDAPPDLFDRVDLNAAPEPLWEAAARLLQDAVSGDNSAAAAVAVLAERSSSRRAFAAAAAAWAQVEAAAGAEHALDPDSAKVVASDPRLTARLSTVQPRGLARVICGAAADPAGKLLSAVSRDELPAVLQAVEAELGHQPPGQALDALLRFERTLGPAALPLTAAVTSRWTTEQLAQPALHLRQQLIPLLAAQPDDRAADITARLADDPQLLAWLIGQRLPAAWRARAAASHLKTLQPQLVIAQAAADVHFAQALMHLNTPLTLEAFRAAEPHAPPQKVLRAVEHVRSLVTEAEALEIVLPAASTLPPRSRLRVYEQWAPTRINPDSHWLASVCDAYAATILAIRDTEDALPRLGGRAFAVPVVAPHPAQAMWLELVDALRGAYRTRRLSSTAVERATRAIAAMTHTDADAATEVLVDVCVDYATVSYQEWSGALSMARASSREPAGRFLVRLARAAWRAGDSARSSAALWTIFWAADAIDKKELSTRDAYAPPLNELHQRLRRRDAEELAGYVEDKWSRQARKWLRDNANAAEQHIEGRRR